MASSLAFAASLAIQTLFGADQDADLARCRSAARHGEAVIEIVQVHRVRDHAKPSPHLCSAEVTVRGPSGEMRRVYADIDAVGDRYGVAILPDAIGRYRAVAKLGDYDGRLLLVDKAGGVIDLPGPIHYLAYGRFLLVEHHTDGYAITVYDVSANMQVYAANAPVLASMLGRPVGDPPRWIEVGEAIYLWPDLPDGPADSALRLDRKHGGLVPARLSAEDVASAKLVHFRGLEAWRDCSCEPAAPTPPPPQPLTPGKPG